MSVAQRQAQPIVDDLEVARSQGRRSAPPIPVPWRWPLAAAALSLTVSAVHGLLGTGFVLDDWFTLRNAAFDGAWAAAGSAQQVARPGAAVVYAVLFGLIGPHPLAALTVLAAVGATTAALLVVALRSFLPERLVILTVVLYVLLPNHVSLEVWASAANISLSVMLTVAATVAMVRPGRVRWTCVPLLVSAALCYEAVIPVAAVLVIVAPWIVRRRPDLRLIAGCGLGLGGVAVWIVTHWHPDKHVASTTADLSQAVGAHLGWGVAPAGPVASLLLVIGVTGVLVAVSRLVLPSTRAGCGPSEHAVVAGVVIIVLGVLPFARYLYAPLGAGDRFNFVSSVGGALVWAGTAGMLWRWRRPASVGLVVVLLTAGMVARAERSLIWQRAAHDAIAIQRSVVRTIPDPKGPVALGPAPIQQQNVAAFVDQSNVAAALQLAYGDPDQQAVITFSQAEYERYAQSDRFDIRPVSELRPDVVVEVDR